MPVKKLRISFDVDMEVLMAAIANGHTAMNIDAFQSAIEETRVTHTSGPAQIADQRGGLKKLLLSALRDNKKMTTSDMRLLIGGSGYSVKSFPGLLHVLVTGKLIRRTAKATYAATKKGLAYVES